MSGTAWSVDYEDLSVIVWHALFSDINLAQECETDCGSELYACVQECGADNECGSSCYRQNIVCIDSCPCHRGKTSTKIKAFFKGITLKVWLRYQKIFQTVLWAVNNAKIQFANLSWHWSCTTIAFYQHSLNPCSMIFKVNTFCHSVNTVMTMNLRESSHFWFRSWQKCHCWFLFMRSLVKWRILHYR